MFSKKIVESLISKCIGNSVKRIQLSNINSLYSMRSLVLAKGEIVLIRYLTRTSPIGYSMNLIPNIVRLALKTVIIGLSIEA